MSKSQNRKLAAILFADIVGYSSLMEQNEVSASKALNKFRDQLTEKVAKFEGRIVNFYGDGCLAVFESPLQTMRCAMEVQKEFQSAPVVPVRIGLHSGVVVFEGDNVYGDSVNQASRVESMGVAGSILLSERIQKDIKNQGGFQLSSLGKFKFKNIQEPMELFALSNEGFPIPKKEELHGKIEKMEATPSVSYWKWALLASVGIIISLLAFNLFKSKGDETSLSVQKDQAKSIAILPFRNLSANPEETYFADGIVEAIRSKLAQIADLQVTSMTSVMGYRGTNKTIPEIAKELGVHHLLEGTVYRDQNKVRVIVQLIDAAKDNHVWAETYDQELTDIFAIQSNIANEVSTQLKAKLTPQEELRLQIALTTDVSAYDLYLSALNDQQMAVQARDSGYLNNAFHKLMDALRIDSTYDEFHVALGRNFYYRRWFGYGDEILDSANYYIDKALQINPYNDEAYTLKTNIAWHKADFQGSKAMAEKALNLAPNNTSAIWALAKYYRQKERDYEKAIPLMMKAVALDPLNQTNPEQNQSFYSDLRTIFLNADMIYEAEAVSRKAMGLYSNNYSIYGSMALIEQIKGNYEAAEQFSKKQYELKPEIFWVIDNYAYKKLLNGNYVEAEKLYRELMEIIESGYNETYDSHTFRHRLAYVVWQQGRKEEAQKLFEEHLRQENEFIAQGTRLQGQEYDIAGAYAFLGEKEKAYEWLEKMPYWWVSFQFLKNDPLFDSLRGEDRFKRIVADLQKQADRMRKSVEKMKIEGQLMFAVE